MVSYSFIWKIGKLAEMITPCHSLSFVVTRCQSLSLVVTCCTTRCRSLYHLLSLVVPLVVIRCHSLSFVVPLVVIRYDLLSLDVLLVCLFINDPGLYVCTTSFLSTQEIKQILSEQKKSKLKEIERNRNSVYDLA